MRFKPLLLAAVALSLAGCASSPLFQDKGKVELTEVGNATYRLYTFNPWESNYGRFRDSQIVRAKEVCEKNKRGAQLIDAVTQPKEGGHEGIVMFKCVGFLPPPPSTDTRDYNDSTN